MMRTFCTLGSNRREVARMEWLRLLPNTGALPQTVQTLAIPYRPLVARDVPGVPDAEAGIMLAPSWPPQP
jgi:hypothetical protein